MVTVSAPGKLMLFGEHSVVYGRPCIVAAVNRRMEVEIEATNGNKVVIIAPEMNIKEYSVSLTELDKEHPKEIKFVLTSVKNFFEKHKIKSGLSIKTKSQFSSQFGFGSSSAVTVCVIKALSEIFGKEIDKKGLFDLAYKTVLDIQGSGSGFDIAAAIYGGVICFVTGGKVIEPLNVKNIPLIVGYTGIKASTPEIVKAVKSRMEKNPKYYDALYDKIKNIVNLAKKEIEKQNWEKVGELMNQNQEILKKFKTPSPKYGVSSEIIEKLISACLKAGAYGAKLSGAGVGDCIIALGRDKEKINQAIKKAGGIPIDVGVDYEGSK